jgi:hypothetical protein
MSTTGNELSTKTITAILVSCFALIFALAFVIALVLDKKTIWCGSDVEGLPAELYRSVSQACQDYVAVGLVERDQLKRFLKEYQIIYSDVVVPGILGEVIRFDETRTIKFRVPFCLERDEVTGSCCHFLPQATQVSYHEMGHIALWAAGIPTSEHHQIMHERMLCPKACNPQVLH